MMYKKEIFKGELVNLEEEHLNDVKKEYSLYSREYEKYRLLTGQFLSRILKKGIEEKWDEKQEKVVLKKAKNILDENAEIYSNSTIEKSNAEIIALLENKLSLN